MKHKKWLALLVAICCFSVLLYPVSAIVSPNETFYVYDGAQVLSQETEQYIVNASSELASKTGAQIVVVTIPSLEGRSLEEYATDLFRQWGIGDAEKNNGLLLLCAVEDRQFRVEVGYGLEGDLPDGKTGRMQDSYIIPLLREDQFDEGIRNGYSAFLQEVADIYDVSITGEEAVSYDDDDGDPAILTCLIIAFAVSALSSGVFLGKKKSRLTGTFWIIEAVQLIVMAIILHSFVVALWVVGISLAFTWRLGIGGMSVYRGTGYRGGGGFSGGSFGGGGFSGGSFGGGGFSGGGGRSGGGGSSRGF